MQIIPFLALGLGVDDMFLLTHSYASSSYSDGEDSNQRTSRVLRTTGLSVLITSLCNICAFFAAALIPIPALRVFSLQVNIFFHLFIFIINAYCNLCMYNLHATN